jgi:hypothetical protein
MTESFNRKLGRLAQNVSGTGSITTNAATASTWQNARTITLGGDLSGNVSIDGSENVTLTATVSGNTVALGTDTTGNYVATISAGSGITVTGSGTETAAVTVSIDNTVATLTGEQTLTNKTISGANNTLSNIANASLTNSSITINGTSTALGGTRTLVTDDIAEDGSPVNLWYTDGRARAAISVTDAGGDGSLSYTSGTGVITYTGPSASEVRAHFSAGTGVAISSGQVSIGQAVATTDNVTFAGVTADNIRVGVTAAGEIDTSAGNLTLDSTGGTTVMDDDVNVTGNLQIDGNLTVSGTTVTINATNLAVEDNMIYLNSGSTVTHPDLGFAGNYNDGTYRHAGLFRDESDGRWKFFHQYTPEPDASAYIDITHASFALAPVQASSFIGSLTGNASTASAWATGRTLTLSGDVTGTSAAFDGSGNISISTTIAADSVALGTDTTGDYVATVAVSGTGLSVSGSGENATYTITSNATSANTASTIVARDGSGNFSAGTITAALSGNASTATNVAWSGITSKPTTLSGFGITDALPISGGSLTGNLQFGANLLQFDQSGTRSWSVRATGGNLDVASGDGNGAFRYNGNAIWTAGNDGAGSGLDADLLDGYSSATAATANTIVLRDSGADITGRYFFGVHFNQSSSNSENPTIAAFWTNSSSDNYNRKSTPAHVISQLGLLTTSNYSSYALPLSGGTLTGGLTITGADLVLNTGGVNTYGLIRGYPNTNHLITMRANITGATAGNGSPTYTAGHQMCLVEYAEANDTTGWFFKSSQPATYTEVARITRSGITWSGNTVLHAGNVSTYALPIGGGTLTGGRSIELNTGGGYIAMRGEVGGWSMGTYFQGSAGTTRAGFGALGGNDALTWAWIGTGYDGAWMTLNGSAINSLVALQQGGNQVLHAGNVGSYAWTSTNDGAGSGLDADLVDGYHVGTSTSTIPLINSSRNISISSPESYSGEIRLGAAWNRGGIYGDNSISVSTESGKFIDHVHNNTTTMRHVSDANGSRVVIGSGQTSFPYTLVDANARPTMYLRGQYPALVLDHTATGNTSHGPTIQFAHDGLGARQWLIGTSGDGTKFDMGFSSGDFGNTDYNPHNGIAGYAGATFMTVRTNGRMGFGWDADWGAYGANSEPLHRFHFIGSFSGTNHVYLFRNTSSAAGNAATAMFVNTHGDHSWGVVAEFRIDSGAGYDKPSILFSQGQNNNTYTIGFGYNDAEYFRVNRDHGWRNGGWGTTVLSIDRSGNGVFAGNVTAYSDRRIKKDIKNIENGLELVQRLQGVTYKLIENDKAGVGLIAQDVEEVLPELVLEVPTTTGEMRKAVSYGNFVAVLIEAIKEQQKQIDELKKSRGIE